jgi:TolA-binding protein
MSRHKITRQEIKKDEFVSTVGRLMEWAEENVRTLLLTIGGILLVILAGFGIYRWQESRQMAAETALDRVTEAYHGTVGDEGTVGGIDPGAENFATDSERIDAAVQRADEVIDAYGSTAAGERARYYRALALFEGDRLDDAEQGLDEFLSRNPGHFLAPFARWKQAQILEQRGDRAAACEGYRGLLEVQVPEFPNELAFLDLGRCLNDLGEPGQAADAYRRMLDEYPESLYATDARQRLVEIEGVPG